MEDNKWFSFNRPTALKQLQNILREYHDEIQILHELAQNAEDARASVIKIMHARRHIDPGEDSYGDFFKSPALCVYNDAVFDEDDWKGITSVCLSPKEDKRDKIGRYGQGFKSIFHLTDYPIVISGDSVLVINPFNVDGECGRFRLKEIDPILQHSEVYNVFGLNKSLRQDAYNGTIFWFPLRVKESQLSKKTWNESKIQTLLRSFQDDTHLVLLFLKHLQCIEISEMTCHETLLQQVKMTYPLNKRSRLIDIYSNLLHWTEKSLEWVSNVEISVTDARNRCTKSNYTIVHYYASRKDVTDRMAELVEDSEISCLPYVGIAFLHTPHRSRDGRIFNFLPLPSTVTTNLPVHINANFALSQNRRELKLADGRSKDKFAEWNEKLAEELLSDAYVCLVQHLIDNFTSCDSGNEEHVRMIYNSFPQGEVRANSQLWGKLVSKFYQLIDDKPIFYSTLKNGVWVDKTYAVVCNIGALKCYDSKDRDEVEKVVKGIMLESGIAVVELYSNMDYLRQHVKLKDISRLEILALLKENSDIYKDISSLNKVRLLQYLMQESSEGLDSLELIPLYNGNFAAFVDDRETIYVCKPTDIQIFVGMEHRFVTTEIPERLFKNLLELAQKGKVNMLYVKFEDTEK